MSKVSLAVGVATLLVSSTLAAHHSPIIFDQDTVVSVLGTVSRYDWKNPHVYIYVEARDSTGDTREWQLETDPIPILLRNGWTPASLIPGERVTVTAYPDRMTQRAHALLITIEKEDGTVLSPIAGMPGGEPPVTVATGLAGLWEQHIESFAQLYRRAQQISGTEKGAAARAQYDIRTENPMARCIPYPSPAIIGLPQYVNEIEVRDDRVIIRTEFYGVERIVHTDGRNHPENGERTIQGHSIGRWEAENVLIVDTALFADHRSTFPGTGLPSGARKNVRERYSLSQDGTRIVIDFTLEDPEFLVEPFSGTLVWHHAPHQEFLPFPCDPDEATRFMAEAPQ